MSSRTLVVAVALIVIVGLGIGGYVLYTNRSTSQVASTSTPSALVSKSTNPSASPSATAISSSSILTADPTLVTTDSKSRFALAAQKISAWDMAKKNAQFSGLFMTFDPSLSLNSTTEVYVFDSADDSTNHYTVSVSQTSGSSLRAIIPVADYQGVLLPIDQKYWQSNYVEAIQTADKNGGKDFRQGHSVTSVDVNLLRTSPNNYLYWVVTYKTKDASTTLSVKVNANDKTVVRE